MKKVIFVTGVTGSGKSSISKKLNELGNKAHDIEEIDGLFCVKDNITGQVIKNRNNRNLEEIKKGNWVCDVKKLQELIDTEQSELSFYCGTARNYEEVLPLFDKVILLVASEQVTRDRLSSRVNRNYGKTKEVQDWIMTWKEQWENEIKDKGAIIVDANKNLEEVAEEVIKISKS